MTQRSKFDDLRIKTDRQLIQLANWELDSAIRDVYDALTPGDGREPAENLLQVAERVYVEAGRLIGLASGVPEGELRDAKGRLADLREVLDALPVAGPAVGDDQIEALARALWKARGRPVGMPQEDWFRAERALKIHACVGGFE